MPFKYESIVTPFWAEGKGYINGRDSLGIQNSSVSLYTALMPGLNNVTHRLRYYGFYCWLLTYMEEKHIDFQLPSDQYNYIRKAEYALALYMQRFEPGQQSVAGSDYAGKHMGIWVNVALGAEKHPGTAKGSVYWDFESGVLGQYYMGSLQDKWRGLGLLHAGEFGYFFVTE